MTFTSDWVAPHEANWRRWLSYLRRRPALGLEIGSHEGRSALWFLDNVLAHPDSILTCIDPWEDREVEKRFDSNVDRARSKVRKYKRRSIDVLPELLLRRQRFDFVYVDGDHYGPTVWFDLVAGWEMLMAGGVLVVDDYRWQHPDVAVAPREAIDPFMHVFRNELAAVEVGFQFAAWRGFKACDVL